MDRAKIVHDNFVRRLSAGDLPSVDGVSDLPDRETLLTLFRSQVLSRQLDRISRDMQKQGHGYYTIGSSGHEGMAAVAEALRPTDMAFLHYRDAAFQIQRASQVPGQDMMRDMLLSFAASSDDPISGGRHKVLGSKTLNIPPQTSTIASHLPKAVGAAFSIGLAKGNPPEHKSLLDDAIIMCSFGDASANHSTAQGAFNTAAWTAYQGIALPLLFVCEDNGIGISVPTPKGWIAANFLNRPGLAYFAADGLDLADTLAVAIQAAQFVREKRKPAFLHLRTVRLYGHAGSDIEGTYRPLADIERDEANDPLLKSAALLVQSGAATPDEALAIYAQTGVQCAAMAAQLVSTPHLQSSAQVAASIVPPKRECAIPNTPSPQTRTALFGTDMRAIGEPQPMNKLINLALTDLMATHSEIIIAGEDVGKKGGVYGVTQKLQKRFGPKRVIDTLLDEQSILGLAIGMAHNGFVPMPEIQFLAYLHNAEDQLRGEAATLPFFSNGQYANPIVVRIAGLGYQRGFGGHFHNDNSLAVLRDIPGLIIACPSNGADAAMMLRECVRLARQEQRVCVFIEPIALYPMRDLHDADDGAWMHIYPAPDQKIALGQIGVEGDGTDLAIISYANGYYLSRKALPQIQAAGIGVRSVDMRWLAPLPMDAILEATKDCQAILIVDECRATGSQSEALMAAFTQAGRTNIARVTGDDCFIATGPAYAATLPSLEAIVQAARDLVVL